MKLEIRRMHVLIAFGISSLLLASDILVRFWFWTDLNLVWDANNFNNVVTPIIGIISFVVYGYALLLAIKQNQIIVSQNIKPHFEREFERIKRILDEDFPSPIRMNELPQKYISLIMNDQYWEDLQAFKDGKRFNSVYYKERDYSEALQFLLPYHLFPVMGFFEVCKLIDEINDSKELHDGDKSYFRKRIVNEFVGPYIKFIRTHKQFLIPVLSGDQNQDVLFEPFFGLVFLDAYKFFERELEKDISY